MVPGYGHPWQLSLLREYAAVSGYLHADKHSTAGQSAFGRTGLILLDHLSSPVALGDAIQLERTCSWQNLAGD